MMAKEDNKTTTPVTEESFFLEENTFGDNWMDTMVEQTGVEGELAVDVYETTKDVVIKAPVAGIDPENLDITITDEMVMVKGERKEEKEVEQSAYHFQECYWGAFSRTVNLPVKVLADDAKADFKNGILTIRVPKVSTAKIKKLKVN